MTNKSDYRSELPHSVTLEERRRLTVTGASEVLSFDENQVVMDTSLGLLTVEGEEMHVEKLSLDIGELTLEGTIDSLGYSRAGKSRGSFWSKVF